MESNEEDEVVYASPETFLERTAIAQSCVGDLDIRFPALVDDMKNTTDAAYMGWPERLYVIGQDGRIIFKSRPGPFGFDSDDLADELTKMMGQ